MNETQWRAWGGESVWTTFDAATQAFIIVAIHHSRRGPAAGGVRMMRYNSLEAATRDVLKLSKAMTSKFALVDMAWGGGKTVIYLTRELTAEERKSLLNRLAQILLDLNGRYYAGPDIGTSSQDMDFLYQTAKPYVFSRTKEMGGAGSSSFPTACGVFSALKAACREVYGSENLEGKKVLMQGLGNVGRTLAEFLVQQGATIYFNDAHPPTITAFKDQASYTFVPKQNFYQTPCDLFSPNAQGGILNKETISQLQCKVVVGAANNQLATKRDAQLLRNKGILYVPDFVANLGGAMGITLIEGEGYTQKDSFARVEKAIYETSIQIFKKAIQQNCTTVEAADALVEEKMEK